MADTVAAGDSPGEDYLIFVYGTLKRGQPNHDAYTANRSNGRTAEFAGAAETAKCYPLVVATRYNIPFMLPAEGLGKVL